MKPSEDELIAHIKESLATYEETYLPGAWENFNKSEPKKAPLIIWMTRLSSAAAVLLIGAALFWFVGKTPNDPQIAVLKKSSPDVIADKTDETTNTVEHISAAPESSVAASNNASVPHPVVAFVADNKVDVATPEVPGVTVQPLSESSGVPLVAAIVPDQEAKPADVSVGKSTLEEFLNSETEKIQKVAGKTEIEKANKWALGVVVSPSLGSTNKINMGYGVSMGYAFSDKISLNSGVSYNELAASRSVAQPAASPVASAIAGESKSLQSIEQTVTGIDIPLDIRYNLSKNLYANVGVSAFAVIDQHRNNTYVEEKLVERSALASSAGSNEYKTIIVNEKVTEDAPETEIDNNRYIGFYNFSFGYKQKVAKDKSISIEPFMKVPMKEITRDNLRLMGTGIKLRFDF